jgi:uncharacterized membrane protein YgcG
MRLFPALTLAMSAAFAVACSDTVTTPDRNLDTTVQESDVAMSSGGALYYRCMLFRPDTDPRMQLRALDIRRLGLQEAPGRKRTQYTLRTVAPGGVLTSRLNCWIPATRHAVDTMHALFGVQVFTIQSPCDEGDPTVCYPDPVDVTVPPPECDPYEELDFSCDDDPCTESELAGALDATVRANSCEGGGGGGSTDPGGGGGGSGGGGDAPESHSESKCRNCRPLGSGEWQKLVLAKEFICEQDSEGKVVRASVAAALYNNEWGMREIIVYESIRGNHYDDHHIGESDYHFSVSDSHPGWTGVSLSEGPIDDDQQKLELGGTMAHEYLHHLYPGASESEINVRTRACVGPNYIGN